MDTLTIFEFEMNLANYIDSVKLPAEVKRMVLGNLLQEIIVERDKELQQQVLVREEKNKEAQNAESIRENTLGE